MDQLVKAPDQEIRAILIALCSDDSIKSKAMEYWKKIQFEKKNTKNDSRKRKAESDIKICVQCQKPYYEEENGLQACNYHNGDLERDWQSEYWADHDEDCHGTIDTKESREEYPDGFIWSCCNQDGTYPGCTKGEHKAIGGRRGRYDNAKASEYKSDDSEEDDEEE